MNGVFHYNPGVRHQTDFANAFARCGFGVTTNRDEPADIHVIYGPHYALNQWRRHPRVLYLDRAWWGHDDTMPGDGCVSIGWLQSGCKRKFAQGSAPRPKPEMREWRHSIGRCLILADYGQDVSGIETQARDRFDTVSIRHHPADHKSKRTLCDDIARHDAVICFAGSAGFEAIKLGIPTICLDPHNPLAPVCSDSLDAPLFRGDRTQWLHDLSYAQFSLSEIADGTAWNLLKDVK